MDIIWSVDRIEEGTATLESDRRQRQVARELLPPGVREGDCLLEDADGHFVLQPEETRRRRQHNQDLFRRLSQ